MITLKCPLINASFCPRIYFIEALNVKVGFGIFFPVWIWISLYFHRIIFIEVALKGINMIL